MTELVFLLRLFLSVCSVFYLFMCVLAFAMAYSGTYKKVYGRDTVGWFALISGVFSMAWLVFT